MIETGRGWTEGEREYSGLTPGEGLHMLLCVKSEHCWQLTDSLPCKQVVCNVGSIHKSHQDDGYLGLAHYYPGSHVYQSITPHTLAI